MIYGESHIEAIFDRCALVMHCDFVARLPSNPGSLTIITLGYRTARPLYPKTSRKDCIMLEVGVLLTMDVEPTTATTHSSATGPADWDFGELAVRGYWDRGMQRGYPVTFFVHPEAAVAQADLFRSLRDKGACLGLHMHPWKYSLWRFAGERFLAHFGCLSENEQRELLSDASSVWTEAIGSQPLYFRPGTFSANDAIFRVLQELGYEGGSCSAPGREMPEMRAIWCGAEPDPHRAHDQFRSVRGELDFVNVPLAMDFSKLLTGRNGRKMYADLRPDIDWPEQYGVEWKSIASNILRQIKERGPCAPIVSVITHNQYDYTNSADPATVRLALMLDALAQAAEEEEVRLVGRTLEEMVSIVRKSPIRQDPFVCEGAIFELTGEAATMRRG